MNSNDQKNDDLTGIKFIGPARQRWLRDKFQVRTYRDLAELSVEAIESQLAADGKPFAESEIEVWLAEAADLAAEAEAEEEARATEAEPEEPVAGGQVNKSKNAEGWESVGIFVVNIRARTVEGREEYRTEVSIHENGEQEKSEEWPGLEGDLSFQWMLEQAGLEPVPTAVQPADAQPEEALPKAETEGEAEVKVTKIQVFQPPEAKEALVSSEGGELLQEKLKVGEPFSLAVHFSLSGDGAPSIVKQQATYRARVVANEVDTKVGTHLGDTDPESLVEGSLDYSVRTPEATLDPGVYRLWALVTVQAANTVPNFLEAPLITVV
jgi:hypothetical protein